MKKTDAEVLRNCTNLDANESAFFARQLEHIKPKTYDVLYPEYKAMTLIPVDSSAGPGAETVTYRQYDTVGLMKIIANYGDDLPRADTYGKEFFTPVRSLGCSYGYNIQEIRGAQLAGLPLQQRKANAAMRAYQQAVNRIAWFARPSDKQYAGLTGFLYNLNTSKSTAHTGATSSQVAWCGATKKTPDEILIDLNHGPLSIISVSKGVHIPDTILLPPYQWGYIASTPRSTISDTTILEFFLKSNPGVKSVEWVNELDAVSPLPSTVTSETTAGSGTGDLLVCYKKDPEMLTLEIPQMFEQFAVQERNLEYVIPCHARIAGVIIPYPLSVWIIEGI
jgi:hypothetical protein